MKIKRYYFLVFIFFIFSLNTNSEEKKSFDDYIRSPNDPMITDPALRIISGGLVIGMVEIVKDPPQEYISIIRIKNEKAICFPSLFSNPIPVTTTSIFFDGNFTRFSNLEMKKSQCAALLLPNRLNEPGIIKLPIRGPFHIKETYDGPKSTGLDISKKEIKKYCEKQIEITLSQNFNLKIKEQYDQKKQLCEVAFTMGKNIEFPKIMTKVFPENLKKDGRFLFETNFTLREFYFLNDDEYPDFYLKSSELKDGISYKYYGDRKVYLDSKDDEFLLLSRKQKDGNVIYEKISTTQENYDLIKPGLNW